MSVRAAIPALDNCRTILNKLVTWYSCTNRIFWWPTLSIDNSVKGSKQFGRVKILFSLYKGKILYSSYDFAKQAIFVLQNSTVFTRCLRKGIFIYILFFQAKILERDKCIHGLVSNSSVLQSLCSSIRSNLGNLYINQGKISGCHGLELCSLVLGKPLSFFFWAVYKNSCQGIIVDNLVEMIEFPNFAHILAYIFELSSK